VLADVEDDRARLDPVDGAGDELPLAAREVVEDLVALDLADALQDDLLGGLVELAGIFDDDLRQLVLDLLDDEPGAKDPDSAGLRVDADVDVLVARDAAIGGLDAVLHRSDELFTRDLLLGVQLKEGANEVSTHDRLLLPPQP